MNSLLKTVLESEKRVFDLEKKLHIPSYIPRNVEKVIWLSDDPVDLLPLIASIADDPGSIDFKSQLKRNAHCISLVLKYSKSFKMEILLDNPPKNKKFKILENHNIKSDSLKLEASKGLLRLGSEEKPPFVIDNSEDFFKILMELLVDEQDDLSQSIKTIHAEGPFERIHGMKISAYPETKQDIDDVAWLAFPEMSNTDIKKKATELIQKTNANIIVPIIILNNEDSTQKIDENVKSKHLINSIKDLELSLKAFSDRLVYPPLLLHRRWFIHNAEEISYENDCLGYIWNTTRISGLNNVIKNRLKKLTDFVIDKPNSILGMLHQLENLKILKSFPDIKFYYPELNEFSKLREQGIKHYTVESAPIAEPDKTREKITPEKILAEPTKTGSEEFIEATVRFLNELALAELSKNNQTYFVQIAEKLNKNESSWSDENLKTLVTDIDDSLNSIWQNLDEIDITLKSKLNELEGQIAPIDKQSIPLTPEYFDEKKFFWGDFFQLSIKKMKLKSLDDEIKDICSKSTNKYLNTIKHTPLDEKEFKKNLKFKWTAIVLNTEEQINNLLEDTTQIWELKVKDVLMKLEEFRKKNLPKETKISTQIPIKLTHKPTLPETLNIQIKKQGLLKMFMSQSDKKKWHADTISSISQEVKKIMKQYEADILKWIKIIENSINSHISKIQKAGKDTIIDLEKNITQSEKKNKEMKTLRNEIDTIKYNMDTVTDKIKLYKVLKKNWTEIKEKYSYN